MKNYKFPVLIAIGILGIPAVGFSQAPQSVDKTKQATEMNRSFDQNRPSTMNRMQPSPMDRTVQDTKFRGSNLERKGDSTVPMTDTQTRRMDVDKNIDSNTHFDTNKKVDVNSENRSVRDSFRHFFSWRDHDNVDVIKFREALRTDRVLLPFAENIDFVQCGDTVIVFGVVGSQKIKSDIEAKIKSVGGSATVENRIIVK